MTPLQQILAQILTEIQGLAVYFVAPMAGIGGIGALIYCGTHINKAMISGEDVDLDALSRPFVLGFLLLLYIPFMNVVDGLLGVITNLAVAVVDTETVSLGQIIADPDMNLATTISLNTSTVTTEEQSAVAKFTSAVGGAIDGILYVHDTVEMWINQFMTFILRMLAEGVIFCINFLRTSALAMLYVTGPIAIAAGIFPSLASSFTSWLGYYINVSLWLPLAYINEAILIRFQQVIVANGGFVTVAPGQASMNVMGHMFMLMTIVGFIAVPIYASKIVSSQGVQGMFSKMGRVAMSAIKSVATKTI